MKGAIRCYKKNPFVRKDKGVRDCQKSGIISAFGKEDSYERNPSGVSFVFNHRIFRTFMKVLKMLAQLVKKEF